MELMKIALVFFQIYVDFPLMTLSIVLISPSFQRKACISAAVYEVCHRVALRTHRGSGAVHVFSHGGLQWNKVALPGASL